MTTFTNLSNALVGVGAKPFATTIQALRDNPLAIAEGDPSAPKINQGALERPTPGTQIRIRDDGTANSGAGDTTLILRKTFDFYQVGSVTIAYQHDTTFGTAGFCQVRRDRGGVQTTLTSFGNTTTPVNRTLDVDILPGDRYTIWISGAGQGTGRVRNARIQTNGENIWVFNADQRVEGNTYA